MRWAPDGRPGTLKRGAGIRHEPSPQSTESRPSISSTAPIRTVAPRAQSSQDVFSIGEWLMPPMLGTKIMPIGQKRRDHLRVVSGATRQAS